MKSVFITGVSSGIGYGLTQKFLNEGFEVFGISRKKPNIKNANFHFIKLDLSKFDEIEERLLELFDGKKEFEFSILNAGILGEIKDLSETSLKKIEEVMNLNVWANKLIFDTFIKYSINSNYIITISSGASVNGSRGWGAYSLSKASLNMLTKLYANELNSHLIALAPGLIETDMLSDVMSISDDKFPSIERIKSSPKVKPNELADRLYELFPKLKNFESGSFIDIRNEVNS